MLTMVALCALGPCSLRVHPHTRPFISFGSLEADLGSTEQSLLESWGAPRSHESGKSIVWGIGRTEVIVAFDASGKVESIEGWGPGVTLHFLTKPSATTAFVALTTEKTTLDRMMSVKRVADHGFADFARPDYAAALSLTYLHELGNGRETGEVKFQLEAGSVSDRILGKSVSPGLGSGQGLFNLCRRKGGLSAFKCSYVRLDRSSPGTKGNRMSINTYR